MPTSSNRLIPPPAATSTPPPPANRGNPPPANRGNPPPANRGNPPPANRGNPPPANRGNPPPTNRPNLPRMQSANRNDSPPPSEDAHAARCRSIYEELAKDCTILPKRKKDRKKMAEFKFRGVQLKKYEGYGRMIPRTIDAFVPILQAFQAGLMDRGIWNATEAPADEHSDTDSEAEQNMRGPARHNRNKLNLDAYNLLIKVNSHFEDVLFLMAADEERTEKLAEVMHNAAGQAKGDDRKKLKMVILDLISKCGYDVDGSRPLNKSERGLNTPVTGELVCPLRYLSDYKNHREIFLAKVAEGTTKITAFNWPVFCYRRGHRYNREEPDVGLFKSELLVRVWRHIFMGTGIDEAKSRMSSRSTVAEIYGVTEVTGRTIAYAAVQTRFALSSVAEYSHQDLHFNYEEFYYAIIQWFEEDSEEDPAVQDTLEWWQKKIWPHGQTARPSKKRTAPACDEGPDSDLARSRAARRQRIATGRMERSASLTEL